MKKDALEIIARSQDGIESESAASIIADQLRIPVDTVQTIINELLISNEISFIKIGSTNRYQSSTAQNTDYQESFNVIGSPQSIDSIQSLNDVLEQEKDEIILILGVTSPKAFKLLEARLAKGYKVTVIYPPKKEIKKERHNSYEEMLDEWIKVYKRHQGRNALRILMSKTRNNAVRTTLLTNKIARINVRQSNEDTSRNGVLIQVKNGNTLYEIYKNEVDKQLIKAMPPFRINPTEWIAKSGILPVLGLIVCFCLLYWISGTKNTLIALFAALASGVLVNEIHARIRN